MSSPALPPLLLIGCGKMGGALLSGWLSGGLDPRAVVVVDPSPPADTAEILKRAGIAALPAPPAGVIARVVVVAVKPQIIDNGVPTAGLIAHTLVARFVDHLPCARAAQVR